MIDFNEFELKYCEIMKNVSLCKKPKILLRAKNDIVLEFKKGEWFSELLKPKNDFKIHVLYNPGMTIGVYRFEGLGFDFSWRDFVGKDKKVKRRLKELFVEAVVSEHSFLKTRYNPDEFTKDGNEFFKVMKRAFKKLFVEFKPRKRK